MIRRGLWLAAGAVLGVAGYRRVSRRLARREPGGAGARLAAVLSVGRALRAGLTEYRAVRRPVSDRIAATGADRISSGRSGAGERAARQP